MDDDEARMWDLLNVEPEADALRRAMAELRDKPTMVYEMKFSLNDRFIFRTTEEGERHLRGCAAHDAELCAAMTDGRVRRTADDFLPWRRGDGRWEMTAWEFMKVFGLTFDAGAPTMIEDNVVELAPGDRMVPSG